MKIKLNAFFSVGKKNLPELKITYDNNRIKQYHIEEYLGYYLNPNLSRKFMVMKSLKKITQSYSSYSR